MKGISKQHPNELNNTSQIKVSLKRGGVEIPAVCQGKRIFEEINGSFNGYSVSIEILPMLSPSGNAWI